MGSMMYEIMDSMMYGQHSDHEQHDGTTQYGAANGRDAAL